MRESALEGRCCTLATRAGCYPIKLGGFAVGLPDRAILLPGGGLWLVEFKAPGGVVSPRQKHLFAGLAKLGHPVAVLRSFTTFKQVLFEKLGTPPQLGLDLT